MICLLNTEKKEKRRKSFQFWLLLFYGLAFLSVQFVFNMEQGLPLWPEWLFFNRVNTRARKGVEIGPALCLLRFDIYFFLFVLFTCEQICKVA
jgi:hypothetical protein